ncbi:MAG: endonuclease domain-containing protein [Chloroflexota bacterium]
MTESREDAREVRWLTSPELWEKLKPLARQMRKESTDAERVLWRHLRRRQLLGHRFRRQHSVERFIVDFYCAEAGVVVEVDGPIHQYSREEDRIRQAYIESVGLRVLRFSNDQVCHNLESVMSCISTALTSPPDPLSASGEGASPPLIQAIGRRG